MNVSRTNQSKRLPVLLLILLMATLGRAQGFQKIYAPAGSIARDVVQTADGGYCLAGTFANSGALRVDAQGAAVWAAPDMLNGAKALALTQTADGGFVILGENYPGAGGLKSILVKVNAAGVVQWQRTADNFLLPNGLKDIIATSDGKLVAAGNTRDSQYIQQIWLVKFDTDGTILWQKNFGAAGDEQVSRVLELPGGNLVISGTLRINSSTDFFMAKTDAAGTQLWYKTYPKPGRQTASDLIRTLDGGLLIMGTTFNQISLLKTDGNGQEDWYQSFNPNGSPNTDIILANTVIEDNSGNLYLPYNTYLPNNTFSGLNLVKLDEFGFQVWKKSFNAVGQIWQAIPSADGNMVLAGESEAGAILIKANFEAEIYANHIKGKVYHDVDNDCAFDAGEAPLKGFIVEAKNQQNEVFYGETAVDGTYDLSVGEGTFTVIAKARFGQAAFWHACDTLTTTLNGIGQTVTLPNSGVRAIAECPLLDVEIGAGLIRRCTTLTYYVDYCNNGNMTATNAYVQVDLADAALTFQNSSIPLTNQTGTVLTFNVSDVEPGDCQSFTFQVFVSCATPVGYVFCTEAHIYPDSSCLPASPQWDGSTVELTTDCSNTVSFTLRNSGLNNMQQTQDYVIIEDQIMYMMGNFQLNANEDTTIVVPAPLGDAYYFNTSQTSGNVRKGPVAAVVNNCNSSNTSNLALQMPLGDADPFIDIHCDDVVGSYDPNDKRGFPLGWQAAHYIERGQELDYMVRFQNTGNDTAFLVIVKDQIPAELDVSTLRPGASSHPYTWEVTGQGEVSFAFPRILLPDSTTNQAASNGYVMFRIQQKPNLPYGTMIENKASIFFDFNDPIITNKSTHTIRSPFVTVVKDPVHAGVQLKVFPNPFTEQVNFQLQGIPANAPMQFTLTDALGRTARTQAFTGTEFQFQRDGLASGIYFFRLDTQGKMVASGRVIVP